MTSVPRRFFEPSFPSCPKCRMSLMATPSGSSRERISTPTQQHPELSARALRSESHPCQVRKCCSDNNHLCTVALLRPVRCPCPIDLNRRSRCQEPRRLAAMSEVFSFSADGSSKVTTAILRPCAIAPPGPAQSSGLQVRPSRASSSSAAGGPALPAT
jgi:hypothetical protein